MTTINYPYLPKGHTIEYVPSTDDFMCQAKEACELLSTDHQHSTGAVVVHNNEVVGRGANQAFYRTPTLIKLHKAGWLCPRRWFKIPSGTHYWMCPGCASSGMHAESQASKDAHRKVGKLAKASLYLYGHWWCCEPCWNSMIKVGITQVYLLEDSHILFNRDHEDNIL